MSLQVSKKRDDALGRRVDRQHVFSSELLSADQDPTLDAIVQRAAVDLGTEMALVTLVLDRIQYFKAHHGLPDDLVATRATDRCVSFCQYVVRDEVPLEINDAAQDERVPQALVERYGIAAYLGHPLRLDGVVVGSLCVLDTRPRAFSEEDRSQLGALAQRATDRLAELDRRRHRTYEALTSEVTLAGLQELRESLVQTTRFNGAVQMAAATLRSHFELVAFRDGGGALGPGAWEESNEQAKLALEDLDEATGEVELSLLDVGDCAVALDQALAPGGGATLDEVLKAAQDLARYPCRRVGGSRMHMEAIDARVATPRALAVGIVAAALGNLAARLAPGAEGIAIAWKEIPDQPEVLVSLGAAELSLAVSEEICERLASHVGNDSTLRVEPTPQSVDIRFQVLSS